VRSRKLSGHKELKNGGMKLQLTGVEQRRARALVAAENGEEKEGFAAGVVAVL
jgi:hypothetical protein